MNRNIEQYASGSVFDSFGRIGALVRRHLYLMKGSGPRILEMAYWPMVQMVLWGFITMFLSQKTDYISQAFGVLLTAVLLWDTCFRSNITVALSFLEEMWSRNLGHLFVSPLRPHEMIISLMTMSLIRTTIGVIPATILAMWFFGFSIYSLGWPLIAFYINLAIMGWSFGLVVCGLVLKYGLAAESLAWLLAFAVAPITGIYYPIDVLPEWLQWIAYSLPSTHIFAGMRAIVVDSVVYSHLLLNAAGLNAIFIGFSAWFFMTMFRGARREGKLLQMGE